MSDLDPRLTLSLVIIPFFFPFFFFAMVVDLFPYLFGLPVALELFTMTLCSLLSVSWSSRSVELVNGLPGSASGRSSDGSSRHAPPLEGWRAEPVRSPRGPDPASMLPSQRGQGPESLLLQSRIARRAALAPGSGPLRGGAPRCPLSPPVVGGTGQGGTHRVGPQ